MKTLLLTTLFTLTSLSTFAAEGKMTYLPSNLPGGEDYLHIYNMSLQQGGFITGEVPRNAKVTLNGKPVPVAEGIRIVIGFDREAPLENKVKICSPESNLCETRGFTLAKRTYKTQNVTKIPKETVTPDPAQEKTIAEDNAATQSARDTAWNQAPAAANFTQDFQLPINAETSGVYGSRRTYNGEERSWHKGHDLAAKTGTPVHAPAGGIVRLARNTFMSGNLIMLDHDGGLTTVYAHLSKMNVKAGDEVQTGDIIGLVGTTGRSSGPHLHWGAYWQNIAIDPILWVKPSTSKK